MAYAEGLEAALTDFEKIVAAQLLLDDLFAPGEPPRIAAQTLAELFHLLVRKAGYSREEASVRVSRIRALASIAPTDGLLFDKAMQLAVEHRLQIYDAIILAAAAHEECDVLLSEDLQDGFEWQGLTVRNPFGAGS